MCQRFEGVNDGLVSDIDVRTCWDAWTMGKSGCLGMVGLTCSLSWERRERVTVLSLEWPFLVRSCAIALFNAFPCFLLIPVCVDHLVWMMG